MIKLIDILENKILVPRRGREERFDNYQRIIQKQIQQYVKGGSKGDLNLSNTNLKSLPNNLKVGGNLKLYGSSIVSLPYNLEVGGNVDLRRTFVRHLEGKLTVGRDFYANQYLTNIPDNMTVKMDLLLDGSKVNNIPKNLRVGGNMDLSNTPLGGEYREDLNSEEIVGKMIEDKGGEVKGRIFID